MNVYLRRAVTSRRREPVYIYTVTVDFRHWGIATTNDTFTGMCFNIVLMSPSMYNNTDATNCEIVKNVFIKTLLPKNTWKSIARHTQFTNYRNSRCIS